MIEVLWTKLPSMRLNERYRKSHEAGLSLLKAGLVDHFGEETARRYLKNIGHNKYGKPFLMEARNIHFNITHSKEIVACAFADAPIGIDVEEIENFNKNLPNKILTSKERAYLEKFKENRDQYNEVFFRFWTLKESYIKFKGKGLSLPMKDFTVKPNKKNAPPTIESKSDLNIFQTRLSNNSVLAVCTLDKTKPKLTKFSKNWEK